ncbi:dihydrolipoamide acyltransferase [Palleniella muris]|uniref:Dihydrolipoamide acyltransferase n=1 Tax=Palleniella muris TaxID=3038145 RepID=A0AC61QQI6_9BACT|nr:dihydrolipoamide acyltransferase [Palleniella muris]
MEKGLTHTSCLTVKESDTAIALGSGDMPVLATPRMMALMENAAMLAVAGSLQEGETTVGGHIESSHLCPTPVGKAVEATARLTKVDGRKLTFEIEAYCDGTLLGKGSHLRFIVNREKFLGRL